MHDITKSSEILDAVSPALAHVVADLPGGSIQGTEITCDGGRVLLEVDRSLGESSGYQIRCVSGGLTLAAGAGLGFLSGILNLAEKLRCGHGRLEERIEPRFTSRLYKHEPNIGEFEGHGHAWIAEMDEEFWIEYVKALVRKHFTGLVFYAGYHPFEYFLDYNEFPEAASAPKRKRRKTLEGLRRAFGAARSFGLETFMQHYVTHYPAGLAKKHKIGFQGTGAGSRLSALDHPLVDEYSRYVYRRTFETLPELSGFYLNFESAPNSSAFVKRNLHPEAVRAGTRPIFILRLWDFNSPLAMKDLIESYPGETRLAHKIQDRADYYYYPKADPRVIEWKKHFPDTEFMFLVGPCHNCGTVQSRQLWADSDFVRDLLADAEAKGADSIAFHTVFEHLAPEIAAEKLAGAHEIDMARLNRGHLDAVVDYVRGETPGRATLKKRFAERTGFEGEKADAAFRAVSETSRITLTIFSQFWHSTSEEGYLYGAIRSYYQDPFLHLTPSFVSDEPESAMTITTAWLNRNLKMRNVPDDAQLVIDYANPAKPRSPRTPPMIARRLKRHCDRALAAAKKAAGPRPAGIAATLLEETRRIYNMGMRAYREIHVAMNLYRVFFTRNRKAALGSLAKALDELAAARPHMRKNDPLAARRHLWWHDERLDEDARNLRTLIRRIEKGGFPYAAFAAFASSLLSYYEIRRTIRPNKHLRPKDEDIIRRHLCSAVARARRALNHLSRAQSRRLRRNVEGWLSFLESEISGLEPPALDVPLESKVERDEGFVPLVHDNCLRYGCNCIEDLLAFFRPHKWRLDWDVEMRIVRSRDGLVLSLAERGVDVRERRRRWREFAGTRSETFFWRFWVDRERTGAQMDIWCMAPEGRSLIKGGYRILSRQDTVLDTGAPINDDSAEFTHGADWWRLDYRLPWRLLDGRIRAGEKWRVNVTATPMSGTPILPRAGIEGRNRQFIWCPAYEMTAANDFIAGKPERMGTITFV